MPTTCESSVWIIREHVIKFCRGSVDAVPKVEIVRVETIVIMGGRWSTDGKYMLVLWIITAWCGDSLSYIVILWHFAHSTK